MYAWAEYEKKKKILQSSHKHPLICTLCMSIIYIKALYGQPARNHCMPLLKSGDDDDTICLNGNQCYHLCVFSPLLEYSSMFRCKQPVLLAIGCSTNLPFYPTYKQMVLHGLCRVVHTSTAVEWVRNNRMCSFCSLQHTTL